MIKTIPRIPMPIVWNSAVVGLNVAAFVNGGNLKPISAGLAAMWMLLVVYLIARDVCTKS